MSAPMNQQIIIAISTPTNKSVNRSASPIPCITTPPCRRISRNRIRTFFSITHR
ncbi:hypothetical protein Hanom_Chr14g01326691 [Helianthus anomalus]